MSTSTESRCVFGQDHPTDAVFDEWSMWFRLQGDDSFQFRWLVEALGTRQGITDRLADAAMSTTMTLMFAIVPPGMNPNTEASW